MSIKFLFINAIDPSNEIQNKYPPLGIGYLVSSLRNHFAEDKIDFRVINSDIEQEIINFRPDIVGISSVSQNYNKAILYAKIAKKYKLPVLCGGVHISMMPSSLSKDMDIGVIGEGEETICDLFELYRKRREFACDDLQNIHGISYWDNNGKLLFTDKRDLIYPLNNIPLPARDLFNIRPDTYMFTSRGCPYRCVFCASSRFWNKVRLFSAEYVVDEIQHLASEYEVKEIFFYDDLFSVDLNRIEEIVRLMKTRNILGKVSFSGSIRANLVNDKSVMLLQEMGFKSLCMGLESGCSKSLKYLKRDKADVRYNENAIKTLKKHGMEFHCSFIIGSPEEKKEDILETLEFIKENGIPSFDIYVLTPFPGTPVWDYANSRGLVEEKMDWDRPECKC